MLFGLDGVEIGLIIVFYACLAGYCQVFQLHLPLEVLELFLLE